MSSNNIINLIIPPRDYSHREGFSNKHLIDKLDLEERISVENKLIKMLEEQSEIDADMLIIETLSYMKSQRAIPILSDLLSKCTDDFKKIIIASSIYIINNDQAMVESAVEAFLNLEKDLDSHSAYDLVPAFNYLNKFKSDKTNRLLRKYVNNDDYLISSNAKRILAQDNNHIN